MDTGRPWVCWGKQASHQSIDDDGYGRDYIEHWTWEEAASTGADRGRQAGRQPGGGAGIRYVWGSAAEWAPAGARASFNERRGKHPAASIRCP